MSTHRKTGKAPAAKTAAKAAVQQHRWLARAETAAARMRELERAIGVYVVWGSSVWASFTALDGMAKILGWPGRAAPLFPAVLDVYWLTTLRNVVDRNLTPKARIISAIHGLVAFGLSLTGNILFHEMDAGQWHLGHSKPLAVAIGASVPSVAAAAMAHLRWITAVKPAAKESGGNAEPGRNPRRTRKPDPAATAPAGAAGATAPGAATVPPAGAADTGADPVPGAVRGAPRTLEQLVSEGREVERQMGRKLSIKDLRLALQCKYDAAAEAHKIMHAEPDEDAAEPAAETAEAVTS